MLQRFVIQKSEGVKQLFIGLPIPRKIIDKYEGVAKILNKFDSHLKNKQD